MSALSAPFVSSQFSNLVSLRLLATTDLHGHLLPHDYIKDQPTQGGGLAGLARLIGEERANAALSQTPVVLFDNGDLVQGTPLASDLADQPVTSDHPIGAALNRLHYDAVGLGNHDLDHGLPYIKAIARHLTMPVLNSNLCGLDMDPVRRSLLLPVDLGPDAPAPLTLGVLSVLPLQSAAWHGHRLGETATLMSPAGAIRQAAASLRQTGADLIVVLAHTGVGWADAADPDTRAAHDIADLGCVDALVLGHTHRRLPSPQYAMRKGVDVGHSTVGGVPALLPGHAGSDLGVMELSLTHDAGSGWHVSAHRCQLRPNGANVLPDPEIAQLVSQAHMAVRKKLARKVGETSRNIHSYLCLAGSAPAKRLIATAQHSQVRDMLRDGSYADLPIISSAAAHSSGGRDGLDNFVHIPPGPVFARHIAGINPFANQTVGVRITGREVRQWLEHAATIFQTVDETSGPQPLLNSDVPAFQFDTIFGLEYEMNLCAPPHLRIGALRHNGRPVGDEQVFVMATSRFRANGGGGYVPTQTGALVCQIDEPLEQRIIATLNAQYDDIWHPPAPWRFAPSGGAQAILQTHPDAIGHFGEIASLGPKLHGTTDDGFIEVLLTL